MTRLQTRMLESGAEMWRATTLGLTEYWAVAMRRRATPLDLARDARRFWEEATPRARPQWHTPNEVVLECPVARLRDFTDGATDRVIPTLVVPPQAGHDSCIVDYSAQQSQMQVIRAAGLTRAFSLDWIGATPATRDATVDDYLEFLDRCVGHVGGRVNLVGDCQGGWLAAIYAALRPESVHTLTLAGAPIDFHAGDAVILDWVRCLTSEDLAFYRWVVERGGGVLKGDHMLRGFMLIKPENEVAKQVQLLANLHDAEFVERHRAFETWYKHVQDIPGAFYLWIVEHLFAHNALVAGELEIGGERVDLGRIRCPLNLLAGEKDHITPPGQVFAAAEHVGTAAEEIVVRTSSGGHLGLFMGSEALREHWPPLMARVAELSGHRGDAHPITPASRPPIPAP
jgi:poly(3-hydroxyalkanoate) synthetase